MAKFKLVLSTFLTLVMILMLSELFFRSDYTANALLPPSYDVDVEPFDVQFSLLSKLYRQEGHIDCIFLGSSIVHYSFDPEVFEEAYRRQTGDTIKCFNFGVSTLSGESAGIIAPVLVEFFRPKILLYGVSPRAFGVVDPGFDNVFANSDWIQYINGEPNIAGFLIDNLAIYRYYLRYQDWMSPEFERVLQPLDSLDSTAEPQGFNPILHVKVDVKTPPELTNAQRDRKFLRWMKNYVPLENDVEGLKSVGKLNSTTSTRIMFIEVPSHQSYLQYFNNGGEGFQNFTRAVQGVAAEYDVPFWQLRDLNLLPDEFWNDRHHMNPNGARLYSDWLGTQVGYAVQQGLLGNDMVPELLTSPPHPELRPRAIGDFFANPYGLSDEDYATFNQNLARELAPQDALIWNVDQDAADLDLIKYNLGAAFALDSNYTKRQRQRVFDLLYWFERTSEEQEFSGQVQSLLERWRQTHNIALLRQAGIDYLLITEGWLAQQDEVTQSMFRSGRMLVLEQRLNHRAYAPSYLLYKVTDG